jgi:hypothetical protein
LETFSPHRALLLTIATPRPSSGGMKFSAGQTFDLSTVIANAGNRTEIVLCACIAVNFLPRLDKKNKFVGAMVILADHQPIPNQYQGALVGPFVLKAGDAITVPIKLSFEMMRTVGMEMEKAVYVHIVALSPNNDIIATDIPISHITFSEGEDSYAERQSEGYNPGSIDIFSAPRSDFTCCHEGTSASAKYQGRPFCVLVGPPEHP